MKKGLSLVLVGLSLLGCCAQEIVELTDVEREELKHFFNSLDLRSEIVDSLNAQGDRGLTGSVEEMGPVFDLMKECLRETQKVSDSTLVKLHPALPRHYRNQLCKGMRLFIEGFEKDEPITAIRGQVLDDKWLNWYVLNARRIEKYNPLSRKKWPELTEEEDKAIETIVRKMWVESLSDEDIDSFRQIVEGYVERAGCLLPKRQFQFTIDFMATAYYHSLELGECILRSIESEEPRISDSLKNLGHKATTLGLTSQDKLEAEYRMIIASARGESWIDEFGFERTPWTRDEILYKLKELEFVKDNIDTFMTIIEEATIE